MDILRSGEGPVRVVAVHGIQGTNAAWLPLAQALRRECRFVLPNLWGRGDAPRPVSPADCTLEGYAAMVRAVIEAEAGDEPYVLAGWSMGVSVVLCLAAQFLRDGPGPSGLLLLSGSPQLTAAPWFHATDEPHLLAEIAARERRLGLAQAADHQTVAWTWQALRTTDQRCLLPSLRLPALVVHGEGDGDCPAQHARALAAGLHQASLVMLPGAGHGILAASTADVAAAVRAHLPRLTAATATAA
ncbi:alpha/beta fold hydrolase [Cupriavidus necator]|uniref:alpha/beta fold hydrolase n=1 Tax=Cupriavidus necator TaxID=106590 RepID=UPI0005B32118|nr:alpha/beta fold hydrolase [Cupriavidus necator]